MQMNLGATEVLDLVVARGSDSLEHYLCQPERLVKALVDPRQVTPLGDGSFRLRMRPLEFFGLHLEPTVDLHVEADPHGTLHLESTNCAIRGFPYADQRFGLYLKGQLRCQQAKLSGRADLRIQVDLPAPLNLMPRSLLELTGNSLARGVLATIRQRLCHHLIQDYCKWIQAIPRDDLELTKGETSDRLRLPIRVII